MKINLNHLLAIIIAFSFGAIMFIILFGCSAQYHLNKYQSKGGICGKIDTVQVVDSFPVISKDTIIWRYYTRDSFIITNDRVIPKTIREIRYDERLRRDTIHFREKEIKYKWKEHKSDNRKNYIWVLMGLMALVAIYMIKKW
jgi:uncharacterized membrane protein